MPFMNTSGQWDYQRCHISRFIAFVVHLIPIIPRKNRQNGPFIVLRDIVTWPRSEPIVVI